MEREIRILCLGHAAAEAKRIDRALRRGGLRFSLQRADTKEEFLEELQRNPPDVILAEPDLPSWAGTAGLALAQAHEPAIPIILVSRALREQQIVGLLQGGATDYVMKHRLTRLALSVRRALREVEDRNELKQLGQALRQFQQLNEQLEQRLRERAAELEDANKELAAFSYSVSHDLRAPLRHIAGYAALLQREAAPHLDEASRQHLQIVARSADNLGNLIDALLAFSRVGRVELRMQEVSLSVLVEEAQQELHREIEQREALDWRIGPLPNIRGDPLLLRQAMTSLLSNALKYTRERQPARIEIGATESDRETTVFVRDNGVGFDMRHADKLFGVFQRLHPSSQFEGIGIGLANVRRIIHRHGGRVWAEGAVNSGATFFFSIPQKIEGSI